MDLGAIQTRLGPPLAALKAQIVDNPLFATPCNTDKVHEDPQQRSVSNVETLDDVDMPMSPREEFSVHVEALIGFCNSIIKMEAPIRLQATLLDCNRRVQDTRKVLEELSAGGPILDNICIDQAQGFLKPSLFQEVFDKVQELYEQAILPFLKEAQEFVNEARAHKRKNQSINN